MSRHYYSRRDLIGHWVRKKQPVQQMCQHPCCRGKRVHPANYPVILPNPLLRRASDKDLAEHFKKVGSGDSSDDRAAYWQTMAEMERRDEVADRQKTRREHTRARLVGKRLDQEAQVEHEWQQAENATRGNMLNKAGRAAGVNERTLFTGPESRARRYASHELLEYWQTHPRPTSAHFAGKDTRVYEKYTAPRKRQYGTARQPAILRARAKRELGKAA